MEIEEEVIIKTNVCKAIIEQVLNIENIITTMKLPYKLRLEIDLEKIDGINSKIIEKIHSR